MGKPGTAYNLYHEAERFMEKVKEEGFCVEKLFYEGQDVGNYEITKKINSAQNPLNNFEIIGHIFEGQLVIHFFHSQLREKILHVNKLLNN